MKELDWLSTILMRDTEPVKGWLYGTYDWLSKLRHVTTLPAGGCTKKSYLQQSLTKACPTYFTLKLLSPSSTSGAHEAFPIAVSDSEMRKEQKGIETLHMSWCFCFVVHGLSSTVCIKCVAMFALTKLLELQHVGILTRCLKLNFQPTDPLDSFSCCKQATVPKVLYGSFRCLLKGENQNQILQVSLLVAFTRMNDPSCLMRLSSLWCPDCQNFEMFRVFDEGLPIKQQTDPETTSLSVGKYPIVPRHNLIVISAVKLDGFQTWPRSLPRDWIIVADFLGFKRPATHVSPCQDAAQRNVRQVYHDFWHLQVVLKDVQHGWVNFFQPAQGRRYTNSICWNLEARTAILLQVIPKICDRCGFDVQTLCVFLYVHSVPMFYRNVSTIIFVIVPSHINQFHIGVAIVERIVIHDAGIVGTTWPEHAVTKLHHFQFTRTCPNKNLNIQDHTEQKTLSIPFQWSYWTTFSLPTKIYSLNILTALCTVLLTPPSSPGHP